MGGLAPPSGHVVGGGYTPVTTSTIGAIPKVVTVTPPALNDSIMRQVTGRIILGATDPGGTETLETLGGIVSGHATLADVFMAGKGAVALSQDVVVIGNAASASGNGSVVIGKGAVMGSGQGGVLIGAGSVGASWSAGGVNIGSSTVPDGSGGSTAAPIIIGDCNFAAVTAAGDRCVLIGKSLKTTSNVGKNQIVGGENNVEGSNYATVVGYKNIYTVNASPGGPIIGSENRIDHADAMIFGNGLTTTAVGQMLMGGVLFGSGPPTVLIFGKGDTHATPTSLTFRLTDGVGADIAGGHLTMRPGVSTGNAAGGQFKVDTCDPVAGSSSTAQTVTNKIVVVSTAAAAIVRLSAASGYDQQLQLFQNATQRAIIGCSGAAGTLVTGAAVGEPVFRSENLRMLFTTDAGSTLAMTITTGGIVTHEKDRGVRFNNQTSGAGGNTGTLTNAPAAGNPGHWLKINVGGTNYCIPCWAG